MNRADKYIYDLMNRILTEGYKDVNPRPHYPDGVPAHTYSVNACLRTYDIGAGEFPICTLRPIAVKTGIKELFAIYQNQSNKISEFERMGCGWWKDWELSDHTIGRAYPYNLESHRPREMRKSVIKVQQKLVDPVMGLSEELRASVKGDMAIYNALMNASVKPSYALERVKNFTAEDIETLRVIWADMIAQSQIQAEMDRLAGKKYFTFLSWEWHDFENFLMDVRYLPQYFLAREDNFKGWKLTNVYYNSNMYSKETCVFLHESEIEEYKAGTYYRITDENNTELAIMFHFNQELVNSFAGTNLKLEVKSNGEKEFYRYELSRNQVVGLLSDLINNPYGRRHIISFWHWANIDKKALVECAYETIWNVRNDGNGTEYLDMMLVQRSGDSITASCSGVNECQYSCFLMMVAKHCGYKVGKFTHIVANEQIYDRHVDQAKELIRRYEEKAAAEANGADATVPTMTFAPAADDFFNFTLADFTLENYNPIKPQLFLDLGI